MKLRAYRYVENWAFDVDDQTWMWLQAHSHVEAVGRVQQVRYTVCVSDVVEEVATLCPDDVPHGVRDLLRKEKEWGRTLTFDTICRRQTDLSVVRYIH